MNNEKHLCDNCGKIADNSEFWGIYYFCQDCIKEIKGLYRTPKRIIKMPEFYNRPAHYAYDGIVLSSDKTHYDFYGEINESILAISHEFLHYLIHKLEGIKASYQFDYYGHNSKLVSEEPLIVFGVEIEG